MINGQKMWLTNTGSSSVVAALAHTDFGADKPHSNLTTFPVEKPPGFDEVEPGLTVPPPAEPTPDAPTTSGQ